MHTPTSPKRSTRTRSCAGWGGALPLRTAGALLALLAAVACGASDPLDSIREQQTRGDLAGSLEPLRELLDAQRHDPEIYYRYGYALAFTGQSSLAEWALRKAMEDPEWLLPAGLQLIHAALVPGNYALAIETADRVLAEHPDNVDALQLRANAHAHSRLDPEAALEDADRLLELDPDNVNALEPKILALLALDRGEEAGAAIDELGRRIEESGGDEQLSGWQCATAAIFAEEDGQEELSRERWPKCLELYPGHPNVVANGVKFYEARGDFGRSFEILEAAHAADPASQAYRVMLAMRWRATGQIEEAEAMLEEATLEGPVPKRAAALIDLAKHYQELERYEQGARAVDRAVELVRGITPPDSSLLLQQADARVLAGEFDAALAVAEQMSVPAHRAMIRARVAQERREYAQALDYYDEAFRLWPDNPWARSMAGEAAEASGKFDRALEEYRYAVRIAPEDTNARTRGARILLAEGKPAAALRLLDIKTNEFPLDLEGALLSVRAAAWSGMGPRVAAALKRAATMPGALPQAIVHAAQGVREHSGPAAAVQTLREWESKGLIDFSEPHFAEALRVLVQLSSQREQWGEAEATVRSALRVHPDSAVLHEILGRGLEQWEAPANEASAAYAHAVELDPAYADALAGLARLTAAADPERALQLVEQATAAAPKAAAVRRECAEALVAAGRPGLAEQQLEKALEIDPLDGSAAAQLVELQLAEGRATDRTLELAKRAVRLRGAPGADELLKRVYEGRSAEQASAQSPPGA